MQACVIVNPHAGSAPEAESVIQQLARRPGIKIFETEAPGDAGRFAAQAIDEGCGLVIAAGGDGTINEVINGLSADFGRATLAVLPFGTGNDLSRTLCIPFEPEQALQVLDERRERRLDLIKVEAEKFCSYCINVAAGGFTGQMNEAMTDEIKLGWGPLAYIRGAAGVIPDLTGYETTIACDEEQERGIEALNIIVANCRTAAGGIRVAPLANPEDGLLDLVVVRYGSLFDLAGVAARLLAGNYLESDMVSHYRVRKVRISSRPGMWFNIDGELLTNEPITCSVVPGVLRVLVGGEYQPVPDGLA